MTTNNQSKQGDCNYVMVGAPVSHLSLTESSAQFFLLRHHSSFFEWQTWRGHGYINSIHSKFDASPNAIDVNDKLYSTHQCLPNKDLFFITEQLPERWIQKKQQWTARYTKQKARICKNVSQVEITKAWKGEYSEFLSIKKLIHVSNTKLFIKMYVLCLNITSNELNSCGKCSLYFLIWVLPFPVLDRF